MNLKFSKILESINDIGWRKHHGYLIANAKSFKNNSSGIEKIGHLNGCLTEKPTIIVSAGPSLIREKKLVELNLQDRSAFDLVCIDAS